MSFTRQDLLRRHERINHANENLTQLEALPENVVDTVQSSLEESSVDQDAVLEMHASDWPQQVGDLEPTGCLAQASTEALNNTHVPLVSSATPSIGQQFPMHDAHNIPPVSPPLVNNHSVHPLVDFENSDMGWWSLTCSVNVL